MAYILEAFSGISIFVFCDVHEKVFENGAGERQRNAARN